MQPKKPQPLTPDEVRDFISPEDLQLLEELVCVVNARLKKSGKNEGSISIDLAKYTLATRLREILSQKFTDAGWEVTWNYGDQRDQSDWMELTFPQ